MLVCQLNYGTPEPDMVPWTDFISGYAQHGFNCISKLYLKRCILWVLDLGSYFPLYLKRLLYDERVEAGMEIHEGTAVIDFEFDELVANDNLVVMYAKCGEFVDSRWPFGFMKGIVFNICTELFL